MKTSWYLYRKINFKLLINNQLGPAWRANISKIIGYFFLSALGRRPDISTLSTLVFLLLQKFVFTLHLRYCCVIRAWSSDFNPFSYLQLWIGSVHQSYTTCTSLGEQLIRLSSLGAGDFILRDIVHQLKLLQLSKFDDRSPIMARIIVIYQKLMTTKWLRYQQLSRSAQWILFQDVYLLSNFMLHDGVVATHQYLCFGPMESSPKAMTLSCPRHISRFKVEVQYTLAKKPCKNVSHHGWPTKKNLVSWIIIRT